MYLSQSSSNRRSYAPLEQVCCRFIWRRCRQLRHRRSQLEKTDCSEGSPANGKRGFAQTGGDGTKYEKVFRE